jgi:hypothetical protein
MSELQIINEKMGNRFQWELTEAWLVTNVLLVDKSRDFCLEDKELTWY